MKNLLSLVMAGSIGACVTLGLQTLINPQPVLKQVSVFSEQASDKANSGFKLTKNEATNGAPNSFVSAVNAARPAVVNITAIKEYKPRTQREKRYFEYFGTPDPSKSSGSGVIISSKGYIVTNYHVIEKSTKVEVLLNDNRKCIATVVGTDPSTDLAVLKIDAPKLPVIDLADSDKAQVGEWVLAVGNPYELSSTVTAGIISAKGRDLSILEGGYSIESFIQTDAAVNPGNSGGALVNTRGELIGINTAIYAPTGTYAGYSFAVPINLVKKVMQDLIDYGTVRRGYMGVMIRDVDSEFSESLNLNVIQGVYISELVPNGSAQKAGLKVGDVIQRINTVEVNSTPELQEQIGSRNPGDAVMVTVDRSGRKKNITVTLTE